MSSRKPNVFEFSDPNLYLSSFYDWKRGEDPDFSLRKWASEIDIKIDVLLDVFKKRKTISATLCRGLSTKMNLSSREKTYFEVLVRTSNAQTPAEVDVLKSVLAELRGLTGTKLDAEDSSIFSHWSYLAILALTGLAGFQCTKNSIRELLLFDVSEDFIQAGIEKLLSLNVIAYNEHGHLKKRVDHVRTMNDVRKSEVHDYYGQVFDLAKVSIEQPPSLREFQCFTIALNSRDLPVFKEHIRQFRDKISSVPTVEANQIYQVNLQLFPLSEEFTSLNGKTSITSTNSLSEATH